MGDIRNRAQGENALYTRRNEAIKDAKKAKIKIVILTLLYEMLYKKCKTDFFLNLQ